MQLNPRTFDAQRIEEPYFSICVPQYSRFPFLLRSLEALAEQTFRDFEVCISDDCSPEGQHDNVVAFLERCQLSYVYQLQGRNVRYDGNLRAAIALARGRYCLLMGNDDALNGPNALADLARDIERLGPAGVVITNFEDWRTGSAGTRIQRTANYGAGPQVAVAHFRNFSFVSGVLLDRQKAQAAATSAWDGSEMYQMYIGCHMIASGAPLLELTCSLVRKDIHVPGAQVDSYATRPRDTAVKTRSLPFHRIGRLVYDAVRQSLAEADRRRIARQIFLQLFLITYPYWLVEYRRVQSWRYALGVALAMQPRESMAGVPRSRLTGALLNAAFLLGSIAGLLIPREIFSRIRRPLYRLAKHPARAREAGFPIDGVQTSTVAGASPPNQRSSL